MKKGYNIEKKEVRNEIKDKEFKNEREWRVIFGLNRNRFEALLISFLRKYIMKKHCNLEEKLPQETYHRYCIKKELTTEQKLENQAMASEKIMVEQSMSGLKRYRILSERLRTQLFDFYDKIIGICAGLWNLYLSFHLFLTH